MEAMTGRSQTPRSERIEHMKLMIEKLRHMIFGTRSERVVFKLEQLEFQLEALSRGRRSVTLHLAGSVVSEGIVIRSCLSANSTSSALLFRPNDCMMWCLWNSIVFSLRFS